MEINRGANEEKGYIKGELLYTIFHNETEHFSIAKVKVKETNEDFEENEIVLKGYFSNLKAYTPYYFYGNFEYHTKFGLQYQVDAYQMYVPDTKEGLIAYLSSDLFYGVGKKTAARIVDHLGENAVSKILDHPEVLDEVPGVKKETRTEIVQKLKENQGFEQVVIHLAQYNIGLKMAQKVYEVYQEEAIEILQNDPYQYVFDIEGFGFQTADEIAARLGLSLTHPNRIGAGCVYILQGSIQDGHVFLPLDELAAKVMKLLNHHQELSIDIIHDRLEELNTEKKVIMQDGKVYLPSLYYAEDGFAASLERITAIPIETETPLADLMKIIGEVEEQEVLSYGKEQFHAIHKALHSRLMILTGGPGTGKTTVVKGILKAFCDIQKISMDPADYNNKEDYPFILTAPTGRAAKRLSESTGLPAVTIHRLLGWDGHQSFSKGSDNQLEGKFIIVDEFSMVDIWLANQLFKAIPNDLQVLLVGDEDQLPSVGPGQVLSDLLISELIPYTTLNEVYRQKEGSKIIQLAHEIKNDACREDSLTKANDFSFIPCHAMQMVPCIETIFQKAMDKGIDVKQMQVLAPMYRSQAGITEINKSLQQLINPKTKRKREIRGKDGIYRVGDKVIQLINQPEDGVYNGDIGEIAAIFKEDENKENTEQVVILFEDKEVVYESKDYANFMLAYCISIHKSQGSEFPIVILPVVSSYHRMLRKNLLYTAITRSKSSLIICGEPQAFLKGVGTTNTHQRYSTLPEHLDARMEKQTEQKDEEEAEILSPYDFM